jgi:hypothetical protein
VFNIAIAAAAKVKRAIERKMEGMEHTPISDPEGHLRGKHIRLAIYSVHSGAFRVFHAISATSARSVFIRDRRLRVCERTVKCTRQAGGIGRILP